MLNNISPQQLDAIEDFAEEIKKGFKGLGNEFSIIFLDYIDKNLDIYKELFAVYEKHFAEVADGK